MPRYPARTRKQTQRLCDEPRYKYPITWGKIQYCKCTKPEYYRYLHYEVRYGEKFDIDKYKATLRCRKCKREPPHWPKYGPIKRA